MDAETETRSWGRRLRLREKRGKPLKEGGDRFIEQWDRDPKGAQRLRRGRSLKGVRAETRGQIFRERGERETRRDTETGAGVGREAIPTSRRTGVSGSPLRLPEDTLLTASLPSLGSPACSPSLSRARPLSLTN